MGSCPQRQPSSIRRHVSCQNWGGEVLPAPVSRGHLCSVVSDSLRPCGLQSTSLLCPGDFPGKNAGVGSHPLLPGNLPDPGIEPAYPALAGGFFFLITELPGKPKTGMLLHILQCTQRPAPRTKNYLYQNFNNTATAISWVRWRVLAFDCQSVADIKRNNILTT